MERRQYALPHAETKGARRSPQGGGLPKHDAVIEHAWISVEGQSPEQAQDKEDRGSICRFEKRVWHAVPSIDAAIAWRDVCNAVVWF
jgi:hypothetical protein